jgi:hypothetical protein
VLDRSDGTRRIVEVHRIEWTRPESAAEGDAADATTGAISGARRE